MPLTERLTDPDATFKKRAPLCGSTVSVDINVQDGRITSYGQDVKACTLGQAAASILASSIIGRSKNELETLRGQLKAMLKDNGPVPDTPFEGLELLLPAREYNNRHASILLAIDATIAAFDQIEDVKTA